MLSRSALAALALILSGGVAPAQELAPETAAAAAPAAAPATTLAAAPPPLVLPIAAPRASRLIGVRVDPGLTRTRALPTEGLRAARKAMLAGETLADDSLRALAEQQDSLAAMHYVRRLAARGAPAPEIARFARIAVAAGRMAVLPDYVAALRALDPAATPRAEVAAHAAALYPQAWAGNTLALDAILDLNGAGRLFGPLSDKTRARIAAQAEAAGDGRTFLQMALAAMQDPAADRAQVRDYLTRAKGGSHPGVQAAAAALLARLDGPAPPGTPAGAVPLAAGVGE
jgi:hypothetical protein